MDRARVNGRVTRAANSLTKRKERANRDKRMAALVQKGKFPFSPAVQSWLSQKLGKPAGRITEAEARAAAK
jgi:hypothetical protein